MANRFGSQGTLRVGDRRVHLTPIEFALLRYLLVNRERAHTRGA